MDELSEMECKIKSEDIINICIYERRNLIRKINGTLKLIQKKVGAHSYCLESERKRYELNNEAFPVRKRYECLCGESKHYPSPEGFFSISTYKKNLLDSLFSNSFEEVGNISLNKIETLLIVK